MTTKLLRRGAATTFLLGALTTFAHAQAPMDAPLPTPTPIVPMIGPPPPPAAPEMQRVLDQLMSYDAPPIPTLTPQNARETPSTQFAAQEVLSKDGKPSIPPIGDIFHRTVPGQNGKQTLVRFYRPTGASASAPLPMVVYFHGGGFVIANLNVYDASCRALANGANCIVASVAYPLAPENPFPAAPETAYAATQYLMSHAADFGGDARRVAIAGESAGGNLATVVCMMAKDRGGLMPIHQLLVYPYVLNSDRLPDDVLNQRFPSYATNANAMPLGKPLGKWFWRYYLPKGAAQPARTAQYAEPIVALTSEVRGLPPATVIGAQIDALQSEGEQYRDKLRAAGVPVSYQLYPGVTHEFFGLGALVPQAQQAEDFASEALKAAFAR